MNSVNNHIKGLLLSETVSKTSQVLYSRLLFLLDRPLLGLKRQDFRCSWGRYVDAPPLVSVESTGIFVPIGNSEFYLYVSINLRVTPGVTQKSLSF